MQQTSYRNTLEGRSGLCEKFGINQASSKQARIFLGYGRYIELNPLRAQMIARIQEYPWSIYYLRLNETDKDTWLDESPGFNGLGLNHV